MATEVTQSKRIHVAGKIKLHCRYEFVYLCVYSKMWFIVFILQGNQMKISILTFDAWS